MSVGARRWTLLFLSLLAAALAACGGDASPTDTPPDEPDDPPPDRTPPSLSVEALPELVTDPTIRVSGRSEANALIEITGGSASVSGTVASSGSFDIAVSLRRNRSNDLRVVATDTAGNVSDPVTRRVIHDGVAPAVTVESPSGDTFDVDGDLRVDFQLLWDDALSGVEPSSFSLTVDRALGGGSAMGGLDAGTELADRFASVTADSAIYHVPREYEFPMGESVMRFSIIDEAGNAFEGQEIFEVSGTAPSLAFVPSSGNLTPDSTGHRRIRVEYRDTAGFVDSTTLQVSADVRLIGSYSQTGEQRADLTAGSDLSHLFTVTDSMAVLDLERAGYGLREGPATWTASIADRPGNRSPEDSASFSSGPAVPRLLVVESSAQPGATHRIPIALVSSTDLGGLSFVVDFPATVVTVDSVRSAGRVSFPAASNASSDGSTGEVTVILLDFGGAPVPAGSGDVVDVFVTVSSQAGAARHTLGLTEIQGSSVDGRDVEVRGVFGTVEVR